MKSFKKGLHLVRSCSGEVLGTLILVYVAIVAGAGPSGHVAPFVIGMVVMCLIATLRTISGGHINPAVTIALTLTGDCSVIKAVCYIPSQIVGAILGSLLVKATQLPETYHSVFGGITYVADNIGIPQAVFNEALISFFLMFTILMVKDISIPDAPFYIGMAVIICICAGGTTHASMNPALSLGPSLVLWVFHSENGTALTQSSLWRDPWKDHWIYWVGPIGGMIVAALLFKLSYGPADERWFSKLSDKVTQKDSLIQIDGEKVPTEDLTGPESNLLTVSGKGAMHKLSTVSICSGVVGGDLGPVVMYTGRPKKRPNIMHAPSMDEYNDSYDAGIMAPIIVQKCSLDHHNESHLNQ